MFCVFSFSLYIGNIEEFVSGQKPEMQNKQLRFTGVQEIMFFKYFLLQNKFINKITLQLYVFLEFIELRFASERKQSNQSVQ